MNQLPPRPDALQRKVIRLPLGKRVFFPSSLENAGGKTSSGVRNEKNVKILLHFINTITLTKFITTKTHRFIDWFLQFFPPVHSLKVENEGKRMSDEQNYKIISLLWKKIIRLIRFFHKSPKCVAYTKCAQKMIIASSLSSYEQQFIKLCFFFEHPSRTKEAIYSLI